MATPFKTPTRITGRKGVTVHGSLGPLTLAAILVAAGVVSATAPLPVIERSVAPPDAYDEVSESGIYYKRTFGPYCVRDIVCVGPFNPWYEYDFGRTGVSLAREDVNVTAGHDPARKEEYGPYVVPTLLSDDVRICWRRCHLPDSAYASAHGNFTLTIYVFGDGYAQTVRVNESVDTIHPNVVPREYCFYPQYTTC